MAVGSEEHVEGEPRSFADVLVEEREFLRCRREVIFARASRDRELRKNATENGQLDDAKYFEILQEFWLDIREKHTPREPGETMQAFRAANQGKDEDALLAEARVGALGESLAGLALSGGGIRSATFAVGILQGLAGLKLLRFFDVVSTVSGGGYAGGWLAAWFSREGNPLNVERQLDPSRVRQRSAIRFAADDVRRFNGARVSQVVDEEPEPIRHLRRYSSYLNPRPGVFSVDSWTLVAIYTRNVLINLLLLLPLSLGIALGVRLVVWAYGDVLSPTPFLRPGAVFPIGLALVFLSFVVEGVGLRAVRVQEARSCAPPPPEPADAARAGGRPPRRPESPWKSILGLIPYARIPQITTLLLVLGAVMLTMAYQPMLDRARVGVTSVDWWASLFYSASLVLCVAGLPILFCGVVCVIREQLGRPVALVPGRIILYGAVLLGLGVGCRLMSNEARLAAYAAKSIPAAILSHLGVSSAQSTYLGMPNVIGHVMGCAVPVGLLTWGFSTFARNRGQGAGRPAVAARGWLPIPLASMGAAGITGVVIAVGETLLRPAIREDMPWILALAGPPFVLLAAVVGIAALVALLGPRIGEPEREWWGRIGAVRLLAALAWVGAVGLIVFGPALLLGANRLVSLALTSGWIGVTLAGVQAGRSALTATGGGDRRLETLAAVAPPLFLAGLLALASLAVTFLLNDIEGISIQTTFLRTCEAYFEAMKATPGGEIAWRLAIVALLAWVSSLFVNVNLFSLHAMYANRLTRAFLGASRRQSDWADRWSDRVHPPWREPFRDQRTLAGAPTGALGRPRDPNPVTGFDSDDDLGLYELGIGRRGLGRDNDETHYWGPHLIFNTALNLVGGGELAWRDRKADSFALTPLYCGSRLTGYARTSEATNETLRLGRAMAISGAAVDPNMNYHQSTSVTMLLTVFNARLGFWIQNPRRDTWPSRWRRARGPWLARGASYSFLLFKEFLGRTSQDGKYVHLSDGGHFDNLGVYELIRRRCRYIVAVDATENPNDVSDNLGTLVRLCRIDFGVRIQLETAPLKLETPGGDSRAHVVVGVIRYDDVDNSQTPGMLVYIKSTLTGDEPPDVRQYANLHPEFPRQPTLTDQSFDEDQFESYRALGAHVARNVFEVAAESLFEDSGGDGERWWELQREQGNRAADVFEQAHRKMFSAVRSRWTEPPSPREANSLEATRAWVALQRDLRGEPELARIARAFYPELTALDDSPSGARNRAELHAVEQALQMMADAWQGLGLEGHEEVSLNRGWINTFRRLASSEPFRLYWPLLRAQYGPDFARFCQRQLRLRTDPPTLAPFPEDPRIYRALAEEFAREWPDLVCRGPGETLAAAGRRHLESLARSAVEFGPENGDEHSVRPAWLIDQAPIGCEAGAEGGYVFPVGFFLLNRLDADDKILNEYREADYKMRFWIRPAHRSTGIGERVRRLPEIERMLGALGGRRARVRIRYPAVGGEDRERLRWLGFFSLFGFKPSPEVPLDPVGGWTLFKTYGGGDDGGRSGP